MDLPLRGLSVKTMNRRRYLETNWALAHQRGTPRGKSDSEADELESSDADDHTQPLYTSENDSEADTKIRLARPSKESMFLHMKGVNMETLTLV